MLETLEEVFMVETQTEDQAFRLKREEWML